MPWASCGRPSSVSPRRGSKPARRRVILPPLEFYTIWPAVMVSISGPRFIPRIRFTGHVSVLALPGSGVHPLALMEANRLGRIRTGRAASQHNCWARPESETVGTIGSGFQARTRVGGGGGSWNLKAVKVWSRFPERRQAFSTRSPVLSGIPVEATENAEQAVPSPRTSSLRPRMRVSRCSNPVGSGLERTSTRWDPIRQKGANYRWTAPFRGLDRGGLERTGSR